MAVDATATIRELSALEAAGEQADVDAGSSKPEADNVQAQSGQAGTGVASTERGDVMSRQDIERQ
jgi:hypothetical protein